MKFKHFLVILLLFSCELTGCATGKPERIVIKQEGVYLKICVPVIALIINGVKTRIRLCLAFLIRKLR